MTYDFSIITFLYSAVTAHSWILNAGSEMLLYDTCVFNSASIVTLADHFRKHFGLVHLFIVQCTINILRNWFEPFTPILNIYELEIEKTSQSVRSNKISLSLRGEKLRTTKVIHIGISFLYVFFCLVFIFTVSVGLWWWFVSKSSFARTVCCHCRCRWWHSCNVHLFCSNQRKQRKILVFKCVQCTHIVYQKNIYRFAYQDNPQYTTLMIL